LKKSIIFIFILLISIFTLLFTGCNKTLARVDGIEIKQNEVDVYMNFIMNQNEDLALTESEEDLNVLEVNIIDSLIVIKLLERYAEENNITVSSQEVTEQVESVISSYASEEDFNNDLKSQGIDRNFLEGEFESKLLRTKIFNEVTANITVTDQEVRQYYNENKEESFLVPTRVKASHILAVFPWVEDGSEETEEGRDEAMDKIEMVEDKLENGEDFKELARQYSDDQATAENGGDLGYISRGQMVEEFDKALFSLDEGEVSGIVETVYGFHIIKVIDHQEEYYQDFEEIEEDLKAYLLDSYKLDEWEVFIYSLIEEVTIEYFTDVEGTLEYSQEGNE